MNVIARFGIAGSTPPEHGSIGQLDHRCAVSLVAHLSWAARKGSWAEGISKAKPSIPRTEKALSQIASVRKAYRGVVTEHRVLARATEIGLEMLANSPSLLVPAEEK